MIAERYLTSVHQQTDRKEVLDYVYKNNLKNLSNLKKILINMLMLRRRKSPIVLEQ